MPRGFHGIETIFSDVRVRQKKSDVGRPSVDIDRRAEGVEFRPGRTSAAGRTGLPGIDSLLSHAAMVARRWKEDEMRPHHPDRGHLARNEAAQ